MLINAHLYDLLRFVSLWSFALVEYGDELHLSQLPSKFCVNESMKCGVTSEHFLSFSFTSRRGRTFKSSPHTIPAQESLG